MPKVHALGIPCGLPSPGSRTQSTAFNGRDKPFTPMLLENALVADSGELITCKRCKRITKKTRA